MKNMKIKSTIVFISISLLLCCSAIAGQKQDKKIATGNPILPGYFADPTVKKFGDTYYIYATTDGSGAGFGPAQVWMSKDFKNWILRPMNWPTSHWIWAPDVRLGDDGKYYMYYCQPCTIHAGVADTPVGPWKNLLGSEDAVLIPDRLVHNVITLDAQSFQDTDGSVYLYWGTWGIYKGFGCGAGKLGKDGKTLTELTLIPNTQAKDFFEAPFMLKRGDKYYFMYSSGSCHDETYRIQYAVGKSPLGPFEFGKNNPILQTNDDGTVHGPGHHSVLQDGDDYYIVYHRHDNPHSTRGFHRQICVDKMTFDEDGSIEKITPTHTGVPYFSEKKEEPNIAYGAKVTASSFYNDAFKPQNIADDDNGTLWKPATCGEEWIQMDLGKVRPIETIWTQFEYATSYYQYRIETSNDGKRWNLFADRTSNRLAGSPMVDENKTKGRYVRLTVTGNQKNGFFGAVWNLKVFSKAPTMIPKEWIEEIYCKENEIKIEPAQPSKGLLVDINADDYNENQVLANIENRVGGKFYSIKKDTLVSVKTVDGKRAFYFDNEQVYNSDFSLPIRDSQPYTLDAWILNPDMKENECVADFTTSHDELEKIMFVNGTEKRCGVMNHYGWYEDVGYDKLKEWEGKWQHWTVIFDGYMERVYLDDKLISERDIQLMVKPVKCVSLGRNAEEEWPFSGYIHSLKFYDRALDANELKNINNLK